MSRYSQSAINRLGLEWWGTDLVVNEIENITTPSGQTTIEEDGMTAKVSWADGKIVASIRAYTTDGWRETTIELQLP